MIVGIGIDSVMVERIAQKTQRQEFLDKVFSKEEIEYCQKNAHPEEHFAARFAAKEAFLKAIGSGLTISYELNQMTITHDENGVPIMQLKGEFEKVNLMWNKVHLSMTHTTSVATAIVILEQ